jgi:hypothetical protein
MSDNEKVLGFGINEIKLFLLFICWVATFVACSINLDVIKKSAGSENYLFVINLVFIIIVSFVVCLYGFKIFQVEEEQLTEKIIGPLPFMEFGAMIIEFFVIVVCSININYHIKRLKKDLSLPKWRKDLFLYTNVTVLTLASLLLIAHGGIVVWTISKNKKLETTQAETKQA